MSAPGEGISESRLAIYAAIVGNVAIAVTKFVAAAITGSSAMLSEAIHSVVDTGNGLLILLGVRKSQKPPDSDHPFGHGHELYFWTLIVGVLIFAVGGGMSMYEGIMHILHPSSRKIRRGVIRCLVWRLCSRARPGSLGGRRLAPNADAKVFSKRFMKVKTRPVSQCCSKTRPRCSGLSSLSSASSSDSQLGLPYLDGVASVVIGLLLCGVAVLMVYESKGLLIGEGLDHQSLESIHELVEADPAVERVQTSSFDVPRTTRSITHDRVALPQRDLMR